MIEGEEEMNNINCLECNTVFTVPLCRKNNLNPKNLISLCKTCHIKTNGTRNYWFAYYMYILDNL